MTLVDTVLADPDAPAVLAGIEAALRAVNGGSEAHRIECSKASLKRVTESAASVPDGVEFWVSPGYASQVFVAWWTAVSGRRHVRVVGRTLPFEQGYLANKMKLGTRPPVWHVYPDRVFRRRTSRANDLVCVCGCGAVGTEAALGWSGRCCGPCADFRDEHGALPWNKPALFPTAAPADLVAASADGKWVAVASAGGGKVQVWETAGGTVPVFEWTAPAAQAAAARIALAPDGRYLAIAGRTNARLHVFDLRSRPAQAAVQMAEVGAVAFHPAGGMYFVTGGELLRAAPPDARATGSEVSGTGAGNVFAFSPDGARLALLVNDLIHTFETRTGAVLTSVPRPLPNARHLTASMRLEQLGGPNVAFSPDGTQIVIGLGRAMAVHHAATGERRYYNGDLEDVVSGVAYDPGGRWLFVARLDGTLVAHHTDTFAADRSVVLRWSLGPIRALATCGAALIAACDEGAHSWPMAELLAD